MFNNIKKASAIFLCAIALLIANTACNDATQTANSSVSRSNLLVGVPHHLKSELSSAAEKTLIHLDTSKLKVLVSELGEHEYQLEIYAPNNIKRTIKTNNETIRFDVLKQLYLIKKSHLDSISGHNEKDDFTRLLNDYLATKFANNQPLSSAQINQQDHYQSLIASFSRQSKRWLKEERLVLESFFARYQKRYPDATPANLIGLASTHFKVIIKDNNKLQWQRKNPNSFAVRTGNFPEQEPINDLVKQAQKNIGAYILEGHGLHKQIALTFDDGPNPEYTQQILDVLAEYKVPATFFWLGENMSYYPEFMAKAKADNHIIANHTWSHHHSRTLSDEEFLTEFTKTNDFIEQYLGYRPRFFRPPYGEISQRQIDLLAARGVTTFLWSIDTRDWYKKEWFPGQTPTSLADIENRVIDNLHPEAIVLMHDAGGDRTDTANALHKIIQHYHQLGYEFVTLETMSGIGNKM
ncbi:polysaccharide deacetylase family protein [Catenovulum sp. SM1970]|uniref:polysaccharide deacetylase family protein n=1 Tax=Marinifaba aquimaris TaxID=2741323 RepID=UPI001572D024|nr:polysaccharide deacetylase family protein [Marinifaba aquimaris]NTS78788.1 polysaccharide deacetylase family protein [Marinifaba aquimaris]